MLFAQIHIMCVTHYHHHWNEIEINLKLKWVWFNHSMQRNQNKHIFTLHVVFAMLFCCGWSSSLSPSSSWWYNVNNVFVASHHAYICIFICHIRSYATKWMKSRDMTRQMCTESNIHFGFSQHENRHWNRWLLEWNAFGNDNQSNIYNL